MRLFILRTIMGVTLLPLAGLAQFGSGVLYSGELWQVQAEAQSRAPGSYLGIRLSDIDFERAKTLKLGETRGVEVKIVEQGSPADSAGIEPGDVLLSYNGENVVGAQQLIRLVQETPAGRKIKIQVWREGKARTLVLTTAAPPRSDTTASFPGFSLPDPQIYAPSTLIPRPLLVWRDVLLGIEFEPVEAQLAEYFGVSGGVLVRALEKGFPAERAGLRPGDVIVSVRNKPILTAHDFTSCLRSPGSTASITLVRNRKKMDVKLVWPADQ